MSRRTKAVLVTVAVYLLALLLAVITGPTFAPVGIAQHGPIVEAEDPTE